MDGEKVEDIGIGELRRITITHDGTPLPDIKAIEWVAVPPQFVKFYHYELMADKPTIVEPNHADCGEEGQEARR